MATTRDRLNSLFDHSGHKIKELLSPEGVPIEIRIATRGERFFAFALDMLVMGLVILGLYALMARLFFWHTNLPVTRTLIAFCAFLVRNLYYIHFELAWQGRTPGKKMMKTRVINRQGGELTPGAIVARNLTREVEFFLPLSLLFSMGFSLAPWQALTSFIWVALIGALPFFNRENLRAGDLIGGTLVIAMPERVLLKDLSEDISPASRMQYNFTPAQLGVYGAFELQVLEEFLRREPSVETARLLEAVCKKICKKIHWDSPVPRSEILPFLTAFYTAERAELERSQLFGKLKESQRENDRNRHSDKKS